MTRARCHEGLVTDETVRYYVQRADAGLMVSEGVPVSREALGYVYVPGIWEAEQVERWRRVTDAVHEAGGRLFAQLWHVGRVSHRSLQPGEAAPVSASARKARGLRAFAMRPDGLAGFVEATPPRPLQTVEMPRLVNDFKTAARNSSAAGFDGVEIHGANGYLFEQFLNPHVNDRTDRYGGSVRNRCRLLLETVDQVVDAIGADRCGVRLSPYAQVFDNPLYEETRETHLYLAREFGDRGLAYVHLHEVGRAAGNPVLTDEFLREFRDAFPGPVMLAGGLTKEIAADHLRRRLIDLAAFGRAYISNPDLVSRLRHGQEITEADPATFYGGGAEGYTDYPVHAGLGEPA
jgi:2,4-dienoyl-CoA reductase-like NADH-dependent reductase (Old Yellow Enzyme family)